jgi:hypothetical protein
MSLQALSLKIISFAMTCSLDIEVADMVVAR